MADPVPVSSKSAWLTQAKWDSLKTAVLATSAKIVPLLALWLGATHQQDLTDACNSIALVIGGLGGLVVGISGLIEVAHHITLPPPATPPRVD